ncbi:serine hydrolase [Pseudoalteromonas fenneropenaei]|uniref:Serine hydrolase n=1 Tax=Pseudoalteromonas fenneropenaei TaxID=1737459 RepID=A0ABV7CKH6_9GAMM
MYKNNKIPRSKGFLIGTILGAICFTSIVQAEPVDDHIKHIIKEKHIPGLQLAVVKDGKIIKQASYGFADLQHQVPVTAQTVFPINSMTKAFTGVAIVQLAEQGKLSIDDEIGKHLPELPKHWHALKINQLMAHTTGLPAILNNARPIVANDAEASWQAVLQQPFQFTPNSRFSYNQTGYVILGKLIDKYVPEGFTAFIEKMQFNPVGMPQTAQAGFDYMDFIVPHQSRQYIDMGDGKYKNLYLEFAPMLRTAAGMSSTATELAKYLIALQQGKLVKDRNLLWTPVRLNNGRTEGFSLLENGYAMGWQVVQRKYHPAASASGADAVTMITYPEDNISIVVLTNLLGSLPIAFVDEIAAYYIPDFNAEEKQKAYHPMAYLEDLTNKVGFDNFAATLAQAETDTGVMYDLEILTEWGNKLAENNRATDAIAIFQFGLTQNNEHTYIVNSLAEAYEATKQYALALKYYQRLLELRPASEYAQTKVAALGKLL